MSILEVQVVAPVAPVAAVEGLEIRIDSGLWLVIPDRAAAAAATRMVSKTYLVTVSA